MPQVVFLSHGGGPLPVLGDPSHAELTSHLQRLAQDLTPPRKILILSAHWEEPTVQVTHHPAPSLLYDYYGFPPESYTLQYPAPGDPELAEQVQEQLQAYGIASELNDRRGLDHGVFIPLMLMYPQADIPCVQVSLRAGLNPEEHLRLGEALASVEHERLLLLGSGFSFHNMRAFLGASANQPDSGNLAFEAWLEETLGSTELTEAQRREHLIRWEEAPAARHCHPREEHLLPLHVCYGAARRPFQRMESVKVLGKQVSTFLW
jgi:4,5-DOPA dioxygenase extradiol